MSRTERTELCDLALQVGPDAPTLSGDWTVRELVAHMLVREGSPAAIGLAVPPLSKLTDLATDRVARKEFTVLVERLRNGPPIYTPFALPQVDKILNTLEFFVHHEDIRRAQPTWQPRTLSRRDEALLWKQITTAGKGMVRGAPVGVVLERSDKDQRAPLKDTEPAVVIRGLPSELTLYVYGRRDQAQVELVGRDEDVVALTSTDFSV